MTDEAPSALRLILRELPRRKVAIVLLIVAVNMGALTYWRGCEIGRARFVQSDRYWQLKVSRRYVSMAPPGWKPDPPSQEELQRPFVPPWEWTGDEWREAVWPWK